MTAPGFVVPATARTAAPRLGSGVRVAATLTPSSDGDSRAVPRPRDEIAAAVGPHSQAAPASPARADAQGFAGPDRHPGFLAGGLHSSIEGRAGRAGRWQRATTGSQSADRGAGRSGRAVRGSTPRQDSPRRLVRGVARGPAAHVNEGTGYFSRTIGKVACPPSFLIFLTFPISPCLMGYERSAAVEHDQ